MTVNSAAPIDLLRHGETEGGARYRGTTDDVLSPVGWQQMWTAIEGRGPWKKIVSSPLRRCADFAHALAMHLTLPLQLDARLCEMHFGRWENRTSDELMKSDSDALTRFWSDPWHESPPGGESLPQMQARVLAAWNDIVASNVPTLVITHGGPMRIIICHVTGHPITKLFDIDVPHANLQRMTTQQPELVA